MHFVEYIINKNKPLIGRDIQIIPCNLIILMEQLISNFNLNLRKFHLAELYLYRNCSVMISTSKEVIECH